MRPVPSLAFTGVLVVVLALTQPPANTPHPVSAEVYGPGSPGEIEVAPGPAEGATPHGDTPPDAPPGQQQPPVPLEPGDSGDPEVVIDTGALALLVMRRGEVVRRYPIAVGKPSTPSPEGRFVVSSILRHPTWYPRGQAPVPPGPQNPLGSRWIGLSDSPYGIHGTNNDASIEHRVSAGCIRMHNRDVEELCGLVQIGTPVVLRRGGSGGGEAPPVIARSGQPGRGERTPRPRKPERHYARW
ncbi:MAG: L,D-transpeptidase [Firmicutes bacterium]|nr:L,D-transpeptidase [Bacillota bacterium]